MKKFMVIPFIALAAFIVAGCGGSTSSSKVLVDINGNKITEGDLDFLGEINPRIKAQVSSPSGRKRVLDNLVEQEVLYQEAVKAGINRDPKVKAKVDLYRRVIIAQSLVDKKVDEASDKYYKDHPDDFNKLRLSHIEVKYASPEEIKKAKKSKSKRKLHSEKEALDIMTKLKAKIEGGEEFAKVAKESSEDVATKSRGGDLGLVSKKEKRLINRGYEPLLEKAYTMKVGSIGGPIKTTKGYHLVTVTRGSEPQTFDEAKRTIVFKVRSDTKRDLLANLKKESTIVYPEEEKKKEEAKKKKESVMKQAQDIKKKAQAKQKSTAAKKAAAPKVKTEKKK